MRPRTLVASLAVFAACAPANGRDDDLIPRRALFASSGRSYARLSPDGSKIAFVASPSGGPDHLWVAPATNPAAAIELNPPGTESISRFDWAYTSAHLLYAKDSTGDENTHVFVVDITTGHERDLTPIRGAQASVARLSPGVPNEVLVNRNDRDPRHQDLHRVDILTGKSTLVFQNDEYVTVVADDSFTPRLGVKVDAESGANVIDVNDGAKRFRQLTVIPFEDTLTTKVLGVDASGAKALLADSRDSDLAALVELDLTTGAARALVRDDQADVHAVLQHPRSRAVEAAVATRDRRRWHFLERSSFETFTAIARVVGDAEIEVVSRSLDDQRWLVASSVVGQPPSYWLHDRATNHTALLFESRPSGSSRYRKTTPIVIPSRDGLELVSYLTLPEGDAAHLPAVLFVHGGPWVRDEPGYLPWHQLLASRGYAVLSVNFRGSIGFGKRFANAGNHEWGRKMQDDLLDGVRFLVETGIADEKKIAIAGGSYGGYAALAGLAFSPKTFACGVDNVGPSDLVSTFSSVPSWWEGEIAQDYMRVGDPRTEEGKQLLRARSPLTWVDRIERPLLIGQGESDPRVRRAGTDTLVRALRGRKLPVTYAVYPDEGHLLRRNENKVSWSAAVEAFLAQCLGGSLEPIDVSGSSITVPLGKELIPPLARALSRASTPTPTMTEQPRGF